MLPPSHEPSRKDPRRTTSDEASAPDRADETRQFYERLEQTGQVADVTSDMDLSTLPPHITHIRHPDGTIERIGFSSSPYGIG